MARVAHWLIALALASVTSVAHGDPIVLRFGTVAPEGTAWSHIAKQTATALDQATSGQVTAKWYFGGIAGTEDQMLERLRKDQLDAIVSAGMLCTRLAPSMRVLRLVGLFQTREESAYVAAKLKPLFDEEFRKEGFVNLGDVGVGPDLIFSRRPIRSMAELLHTRLWTWDLDTTFRASWPLMGVPVVGLPIDQAYRAYEERRVDGFIAVPSAALAFQWSTEARYLTDLHVSFLRACVLVSTRAFDPLPLEARTALLNASASGLKQLEESGRRQDEQLVGGLFAKQGMTVVPASEAFRGQFLAQASGVREQLISRKLIAPALVQRVLALLADYRAEHRLLQGDKK